MKPCPKCSESMEEVGEVGTKKEIGEWKTAGNGNKLWMRTGIESEILYQCPACKTVKIL